MKKSSSIWRGADSSRSTIGKTIKCDGNLGGSPLRCFALGPTFGFVTVRGIQSRSQSYLRVVVITCGRNDIGNEMIDSPCEHVSSPRPKENVGMGYGNRKVR